MMGPLIIIYAEVMPKILAVQDPEPFLLRSAFALRFLFSVFRPLLNLINIIARISLRLIGKRIDENKRHGTIEELRGAIELHNGPGEDIAEERAMLRSILDLSDVQVNEIMTHRKNVTMIDASEPPQKIVEQVLASPFTRLPLYIDNPDNIIGIIHAKALLRAVRAHPSDIENLDIKSIASKPWFIPESTDLLEQLAVFRTRREHFAMVVDEYGALQGIVTLEDILEEIVGEISDEHDITVKGVRPQADGSYIVDGSVTIRDLNRQFEWELPDEPAATIAGLVLYEVRRIADVGQVFMLHGFRFEVMRRQRNQITLLRITPPSKDAESPNGD
jgi:Mg2+/Co2+ transporter CorB